MEELLDEILANQGWRRLLLAIGGAIFLLILSPLFMALGLTDRQAAGVGAVKEWSEIVQNTVESLAILAGAFVLMQWIRSRQDRAADMLLKLEKEFQSLDKGRRLIEERTTDSPELTEEETQALDKLLRMYVVLYGVSFSSQVPVKPLSICFRYWLAHYYRHDWGWLRAYVNVNYPTLRRWLNTPDERMQFFAPEDLFSDPPNKPLRMCDTSLS